MIHQNLCILILWSWREASLHICNVWDTQFSGWFVSLFLTYWVRVWNILVDYCDWNYLDLNSVINRLYRISPVIWKHEHQSSPVLVMYCLIISYVSCVILSKPKQKYKIEEELQKDRFLFSPDIFILFRFNLIWKKKDLKN